MRNALAVPMALALTVVAAPLALADEPQVSKKPVILVVAAKIEDLPDDKYLWAAEMTAARLKGNLEVLPGGLVAALKQARENKGQVAGIVEILVDVYSWKEEVRITCYDAAGRKRWKDKVTVNMGGSEEALARKMVERAIIKAEKRPACQVGR